MSNLSTLPKGDSAWLLRKAIERIIQQVSVLETNIGSSTTGNSANTQIIFNDAGTLRGDAGLTYNKTTDLLTVGAATITGDLTVDTSTLKVDSANNRVGIGTATPSYALHVQMPSSGVGAAFRYTGGTNNPGLFLTTNESTTDCKIAAGGSTSQNLVLESSGYECFRYSSSGVFTWSNAGLVAGTAMTLNSTGLGVGASPTFKLDVQSATACVARLRGGSGANQSAALYISNTAGSATLAAFGDRANIAGGTPDLSASIYTNSGIPLLFDVGSTTKATIDAAGNVGVGVTPKSWLSSYKAIQLGYSTSLSSTTGTDFAGLSSNAYVDSVDSRWERIVSGYATQYYQNAGDGQHIWRIAGTAAADTAITWTQAMTLDASGNLLVGATSGSFGSRLIISADSGTTSWATGPLAAAPLNYYITANNTQGVFLNGTSATAWTAISDERFKDIIEPITNAVSKVGSLRSVIGKFKTDAEGTRRSFLIAQDVLAAFPEAAVANNPDKLGVTYTEVIPLLVAAIKELTARVEALEA